MLIKKIFLALLKIVAPLKHAKLIGVRFGKNCRFIRTYFGTEPYLVKIGDHVTLTGVRLITHDGGVWVFRERHTGIDVFGPIKIGNNVFVGKGAIILPNVTIGDNCVIGAGSVVTKDIPANSVAAGLPARVIKTIDEYYESVKDRAFYIRRKKSKEKKKILQKKFGLD